MIDNVALLVNPRAGGRGFRVGRIVLQELRRRGIAVSALATTDAASARSSIKQAFSRGCAALVVCGGDGTVHAALQVVAESGVPLGVVPCGAGNDFARALGLPVDDVLGAVRLICDTDPVPVDLGFVDGGGEPHPVRPTWFGTVLAAGFDSRVNDRVNRWRWPPGRSRYNLAIAAELATFRPLPFVMTADGTRREFEAMLVAVGNGSSYGGGMRICPDARPDDGLFDVTVVTRLSRALLVRLLPTVYAGTHVHRPEVVTFRASSVCLEAPGVTAYADGERVSPLPVRCKVRRAALPVFGHLPAARR